MPADALPTYVPRGRVMGKDRQKCGTYAAKRYKAGLSIRKIAAELGGWSYGATHRLLIEFDVVLRRRGIAAKPRKTRR